MTWATIFIIIAIVNFIGWALATIAARSDRRMEEMEDAPWNR